jgi:hypothetical protein
MKRTALAMVCGLLFLAPASHAAAPPSGPAFYGDPPDETHPWAVHDRNRPQPPRVIPGTPSTQEQPGRPPSDAIVLFDGTDLSKWEADRPGNEPTKWIVKDGAMQCVPGSGYIRTKDQFGDIHLHVEWAAPSQVQGSSQGRGNSGIFLPGGSEVQVLDNYDNPTYADGFAGSVYGINPPMVNPLNKPGEYQMVDILFRRPIFRNGQQVDPGRVTVFINGVVVQEGTPLEGSGGHMRRSTPRPFAEKGSIRFQDHGNPVRFRNVWVRPLPPRSVEGGTDGALTPEATMAKRKEIAAEIRGHAATEKNADNPLPELLRLMESLIYENDPATARTVEQMATQYVAGLNQLSGQPLAARRDQARQLNSALQYMARHRILPASYGPKVALEKLIKEQGWDKK